VLSCLAGVLDSGALIGLPAEELASSLGTLERMARAVDSYTEVIREIEIEGREVLVEPSSSPTSSPPSLVHPCSSPVDMPRVHEGPDYSAEPLNDIPVAFSESAHSIPIPSSLIQPAERHTFPNAVRRTRPFQRLPAGTRFCLEVLVKRNSALDSGSSEVAYIDFENFSTSF
jgi:hypothetical protein